MRVFGDYLNLLSGPEFFILEYLEFLGIKDPYKEILLKNNEEVLQKEVVDSKKNTRAGSVYEKVYFSWAQENEILEENSEYFLQKYVEIRINKWVEVKKHIEYEICWKINFLDLHGCILKRYNEFAEFDSVLSKIVSPAKLPKFPRKNYISRISRFDEKSLNLRKIQLEKYLSHVFNDLAFLCNEVLEYLEINARIEQIWNFLEKPYEYKLQAPLTCYTDIDNSGYYLIYPIKLCKNSDNTDNIEWTIYRRYSEFDEIHNFLVKRSQSPILQKYFEFIHFVDKSIPCLPPKIVVSLSCPSDIENRRYGLEKYLEEILCLPSALNAYGFRLFLQDPELSQKFIIN